jgi:hypothetical protein
MAVVVVEEEEEVQEEVQEHRGQAASKACGFSY